MTQKEIDERLYLTFIIMSKGRRQEQSEYVHIDDRMSSSSSPKIHSSSWLTFINSTFLIHIYVLSWKQTKYHVCMTMKPITKKKKIPSHISIEVFMSIIIYSSLLFVELVEISAYSNYNWPTIIMMMNKTKKIIKKRIVNDRPWSMMSLTTINSIFTYVHVLLALNTEIIANVMIKETFIWIWTWIIQ